MATTDSGPIIRPDVRPTPQELAHLYDQGYTNLEIARIYCVAEGTVKSWRHRYGLPTRRPRYERVIPWHVDYAHHNEYALKMLQSLGRRLDGLPLSGEKEAKLDSFLSMLRGQHPTVNNDGVMRVVAYAPWRTPGFIIKPGEWINGQIPIQPETEPSPADGGGGRHRKYMILSGSEED